MGACCARVCGLRVAVALETLVGAGGTVDRYIAVALVALGAKFLFAPNRRVVGISQLMLQRVVPGEFLWYHFGQWSADSLQPLALCGHLGLLLLPFSVFWAYELFAFAIARVSCRD